MSLPTDNNANEKLLNNPSVKVELHKFKLTPIVNEKSYGFGRRHIQTFVLFLGVAIAYSFRASIVVAVEVMLDNSENTDFPSYKWSNPIPDVIKGSFFFGYVVMQVPASRIIAHKGIKLPLTVTFITCSIATLAIPFAAAVHWSMVIVCRVGQGMSQGFLFPCVHQMISKWVPPSERGRVSSFIHCGAQFGTIISMPISGFLAVSSYGWVSIFYLMGVMGCLWSLLWWFTGSNCPRTDKLITVEERAFIESSLNMNYSNEKNKVLKTPWKAILTSSAFWAIAAAHCGHAWGFWTLMSEMPTYMKNILELDIKNNGIMSSVPYLGKFIFSFAFSYAADMLINKRYLTVAASRKTFQTISVIVPTIGLIMLGYFSKDDVILAEIVLTIAVTAEGGAFVGYSISHIDIAPNYAATLLGMTNAMANMFSAMAPIVCGLILTDETKNLASAWRLVFISAAVIYVLSGLVFIFYGSADIQPWNDPEEYEMVKLESIKGAKEQEKEFQEDNNNIINNNSRNKPT